MSDESYQPSPEGDDVADQGGADYQQPQGDFEPTSAEDFHPLAQVAFPIFDEAGVRVIDGDPEFETLKRYLDDPQPSAGKLAKFVIATKAAVDAKRARMASNVAQAGLRVPSGGGGMTGSAPAASAHDYWKSAYKKP